MMQETFTLRKFVPDDLQSVMQINRVCLPENYTDFFFIDLHQRFPETFIVADDEGKISGLHHVPDRSGVIKFRLRRISPQRPHRLYRRFAAEPPQRHGRR